MEVDECLKVAPQQLDYSGAHEKIDAREIALVRKLDWWIMPILWGMYWLNYLVSILEALSEPGEDTYESRQYDI